MRDREIGLEAVETDLTDLATLESKPEQLQGNREAMLEAGRGAAAPREAAERLRSTREIVAFRRRRPPRATF